jgi:glutaredoxin
MNFTIYSKDGCPYCTQVKKVLELAKLPHVVYDLNTDFQRDEFYDEFGKGASFPQVTVNGKKLGGCTDTVKYLREHNFV